MPVLSPSAPALLLLFLHGLQRGDCVRRQRSRADRQAHTGQGKDGGRQVSAHTSLCGEVTRLSLSSLCIAASLRRPNCSGQQRGRISPPFGFPA